MSAALMGPAPVGILNGPHRHKNPRTPELCAPALLHLEAASGVPTVHVIVGGGGGLQAPLRAAVENERLLHVHREPDHGSLAESKEA